MGLDERIARAFDDAETTRFGSGWWSGTSSVFLGAAGLGAFLCGLCSTMQRRRKVLGGTGMGLALAASLLGGARVPVEGAVPVEPVCLGLDWFLLDVFLLVVPFVPLNEHG